jgi:hypothetical protein
VGSFGARPARRTPLQGGLRLMHAEELPVSAQHIHHGATAQVMSALEIMSPITPAISDNEARTNVSRALAFLGETSSTTAGPPLKGILPEDRYSEHDSYFHIFRVIGNPVELFTQTMLQAHAAFLRDTHTGNNDSALDEWEVITEAFKATYDFIKRCAAPQNTADAAIATPEPPVTLYHSEPLERWYLGHWVFIAMIQSLIVLINCLLETLDNDQSIVAEGIRSATAVMRGSGAALHFTGGFSPIRYRNTVRPTMMPPNLEGKFSGLQSRDHRYMLLLLVRLKHLVRQEDPNYLALYQEFLSEVDNTYQAHKYVCSKFGGREEPSLRMNSESGMTAVDALERLRTARLRQIKW